MIKDLGVEKLILGVSRQHLRVGPTAGKERQQESRNYQGRMVKVSMIHCLTIFTHRNPTLANDIRYYVPDTEDKAL